MYILFGVLAALETALGLLLIVWSILHHDEDYITPVFVGIGVAGFAVGIFVGLSILGIIPSSQAACEPTPSMFTIIQPFIVLFIVFIVLLRGRPQ